MAKASNKDLALDAKIQKEYMSAQARKKELLQAYKDEEKVSIHLSPMYRPYMGNVLTMSINGITIAVPVDGKSYTVPKTFAEHIDARRIKIDNILKKTDAMANIADNFESSPGDLELF